jgi:hypothetical protein
MNTYESLIDPTTFDVIAGCLRSPRSPVHYVLYVRDRAQLAPLARQLEPAAARVEIPPDRLPALLAQPLHDGTVRISSRQPLNLPDAPPVIDPTSIPRSTCCDVLYLPPFYLVHAAGLFEGRLTRPAVEPGAQNAPVQSSPPETSPTSQIDECKIEPKRFGELRHELDCPFSDFDYVLHVRDRALLASLAEELKPVAVPRGVPRAQLADLLAKPLQEGTIRVSSSQPVPLADRRQVIALSAIPRLARCEVISLPPFYLVHTPGLFEGTLVKPRVAPSHPAHEQVHRPRPF